MPPTVTIIVAAYNEEGVIVAKIENTLKLEYPRDHLRSSSCRRLFGSNRVDSRTYGAEGVAVLADPVRAGKSAAINHGAGVANGDILVLSDAKRIMTGCHREARRDFGDPTDGVASGRKTVSPALASLHRPKEATGSMSPSLSRQKHDRGHPAASGEKS